MKLHQHKNYKEYYDAQVSKNTIKLNNVWVFEDEMKLVATHIDKNIPGAEFGICHGVRNGWEVNYLYKKLSGNIEIVGTDIAPSVKKFNNCIQHDFHEAKEEWIGNVDFIYSNSFDHSHSPEECLNTWMSCLTPIGICYIHHGDHSKCSGDKADCFVASTDEMRELLSKKYEIEETSIHYKRTIFAITKDKK